MKKYAVLIILISIAVCGFSEEKRNILQFESQEIDLGEALVEDFSDEVYAHITQKGCPLEHDDPNQWPLQPIPGIEDLETANERHPSCPS